MVLFGVSMLPLLALSPQVRSAFLRGWPFIVIGLAVGTAPVWIWNYMNDFASIKFQTAHGLGRKFWKPSWTIHYIIAQVLLVFPVVLYWALRARQMPAVFKLIAWVPLMFFVFTTYRGYVEANWPVAAYPAVFALAASTFPSSRKSLWFTVWLWGALMATLAAVIVVQPTWSERLKVREFHQYDRLIDEAREFEPLFARSYQMASKMSFELGRPVYKLKGMNRKDFFDYLEESAPRSEYYYLAVEKGDRLPKIYRDAGHTVEETVSAAGEFEIWKVKMP
jgi:hypothetical protein